MRYMLDTCTLTFMMTDRDCLTRDILELLDDYDNTFCISIESLRELIIAYNHKGLGKKLWKAASEIRSSIKDDFLVDILPLQEEHLQTFARLRQNEQQNHKDPSDHIIISHAITNRLPLISCDSKFEFYRSQGLDLVPYRKGR